MISPPGQGYEITDSSRTAVNLYEFYSERLLDMLKQSDHGYYLEEIGLGEDLPECALVNTTAIVPEMPGWPHLFIKICLWCLPLNFCFNIIHSFCYKGKGF